MTTLKRNNTGCCPFGSAAAVRLFHTCLCFGIAISLLWKDTVLRHALVEMHDLLYGILYLALIATSLTLYFITCLMDPGYVPIQQFQKNQSGAASTVLEVESQSELSEDEGQESPMATRDSDPLDKQNRYKYRYCDYCEIMPPLRSKHCEDCQLCVRRYDHHCPWLETCIGEQNHKYFYFFLLVTSSLIIWTFVIVWESFITRSTWEEWFHSNLVLFLDTVVLVLTAPVCVGLLIFHTYLAFSGLTTWEASSRERITYLKYLDDDYNPFDEGCCTNIFNFMCILKVRSWDILYAQKAKFKDGGV